MNDRQVVVAASLNLFIAIAAGAFGAHALKAQLSPEMLGVWQTAASYQTTHGLGMIGIAVLMGRFGTILLSRAAFFMMLGIVLFSGSLYLLALTGQREFGILTPFGGAAFLIAWLMVMRAAWKGSTFR
ncbi:MAG: DUF423 domain-containing protein [Burkholderiales bacterium]|nr:DUF423 domain-containing protein [Burkholderiales bacterium]